MAWMPPTVELCIARIHRALCTSYPELSARIHSNTPERFLHAVVESIKDGKGSPKVVNDEFVVPFYLAQGATLPRRWTMPSPAVWNRA